MCTGINSVITEHTARGFSPRIFNVKADSKAFHLILNAAMDALAISQKKLYLNTLIHDTCIIRYGIDLLTSSDIAFNCYTVN